MAQPKHNLPPLSFLVALYPGVQLLDFAGPLDLLNFLPQPPYNAPISMKFVAETKDPVSTKLLPGTLPGEREGKYEWLVSEAMGFDKSTGQEVNRGWNQQIVVDATFEEAAREIMEGKARYDVLFIPGGIGSRVRRRDLKTGREELAVNSLIDFTKAIVPWLGLGIMTVCTGSDILGYTRLLDRRRATTNMSRFSDVSGRHQDVKWQKGARWVKSSKEDGGVLEGTDGQQIEIWTSAGVSAGMDLTLAFIAEKFGGVEVARDIARKSEYDWTESKDGEIW
jgi:putative intracellular protease/amidase